MSYYARGKLSITVVPKSTDNVSFSESKEEEEGSEEDEESTTVISENEEEREENKENKKPTAAIADKSAKYKYKEGDKDKF